VQQKGATVFVDAAAASVLAGAEMDYRDEDLRSGFVFHNPNARSQCGCGESFRV